MNKLRVPEQEEVPVNATLIDEQPEFVRRLLRERGYTEDGITQFFQAHESRRRSREYP